MAALERITTDPKVMHGKPCIKGTRIPVYLILNLLAGGMPEAEVLDNYPDVMKEDIQACIKYASLLAEQEVGILEAPELV